MSSTPRHDDDFAAVDFVELATVEQSAGGVESATPKVEVVSGRSQSLTSATTPLLHARWRWCASSCCWSFA